MRAVLLGAQRYQPTLVEAVRSLGIDGVVATITAGWQEREPEDEELHAHLGGRTINLRLHRRADQVFAADHELREAHRARQERLRHVQEFYRIRLEHAMEAAERIQRRAAPRQILEEEEESSIAAIRALDEHHLRLCRQINSDFENHWEPQTRDSVARHCEQLDKILETCDAVAVAGGHVASLLNRLRLFDVADMIADKVVFAWSGGAMVLSERLVLFHDSPPQGSNAPQVLEAGLGLLRGVVVLPNPEMRLHTHDRERMSIYARRFAPASCLAFPQRARITYDDGLWSDAHGIIRLRESGEAVILGSAT